MSLNMIDNFLLKVKIMLENVMRIPEILSELTTVGYPREEIQQGQKKYNKTIELHNQQKKEYGEQFEATEKLNSLKDQVKKFHKKTLRIARVVFKNNIKARSAMMLDGRRRMSNAGWLEQHRAFYKNLLGDSELLNSIAKRGYTKEKLESEYAVVEQVADAKAVQTKETGEAQEATQVRDTALDELQDWFSDFSEITEATLADKPQWLEKLGIQQD